MKYFKLLLLFFILIHCKKNPYPDSSFARNSMFGTNDSSEIVEKKMVNLDEDAELEAVLIGRKGQEEIISFFDKKDSVWQLTYKKSFSLLNIGPLQYNKITKKWSSENSPHTGSFILKKIQIEELPGDSFNSVFTEVLTEQPPYGLISVPYGFRKNHVILDGLKSLGSHEKLKIDKRMSFEYNKENKSIRIFPEDSIYAQEFVFNGFEMIPSLPGIPASSFINYEVIDQKDEKEIVLHLKNRGGFATTTYLSISFPDSPKLKITTTDGARLYEKGAQIFSGNLKKYIPAEYPLYEITKEGWGRNYKYNVRFTVLNPDETKKLVVYFRSSVKIKGVINNIPNEFSSAPVVTDQQGFTAYKLELDLAKKQTQK